MARPVSKATRKSAQQVKIAAQRLFAERGVDGVTVRDIAEAAGQKNHGIVGYYFGTKEELVRELIVDGARRIDQLRNDELDRMENEGGPATVRDVVNVLIYPSIDEAAEASQVGNTYTRFIVMLNMTHRDLFMDALEGRWNSGYRRCLAHLARLMPPMPAARKRQRFVLMGRYLGSVLSSREGALADTSREHHTWNTPQMLEHFALTLTAVLELPDTLDHDPASPGGETQLQLIGPLSVN